MEAIVSWVPLLNSLHFTQSGHQNPDQDPWKLGHHNLCSLFNKISCRMCCLFAKKWSDNYNPNFACMSGSMLFVNPPSIQLIPQRLFLDTKEAYFPFLTREQQYIFIETMHFKGPVFHIGHWTFQGINVIFVIIL